MGKNMVKLLCDASSSMYSNNVEFAECFEKSKIDEICDLISKANIKLMELIKEKVELPKRIECMSDVEIETGSALGGGHGLFVSPSTIKINPYMSSIGILLNYIHENIHCIFPNASENLVEYLTELIAYQLKIPR
jgi:hypothetical protein